MHMVGRTHTCMHTKTDSAESKTPVILNSKHRAWVLHTKVGEFLAVVAKHSNASRLHAIMVTAKVWICHCHAKPLHDCFFSGYIHPMLRHSGSGTVSVVTADVVQVFWFSFWCCCPLALKLNDGNSFYCQIINRFSRHWYSVAHIEFLGVLHSVKAQCD